MTTNGNRFVDAEHNHWDAFLTLNCVDIRVGHPPSLRPLLTVTNFAHTWRRGQESLLTMVVVEQGELGCT